VMRRGALPLMVEPPLFLSPDNTSRRGKTVYLLFNRPGIWLLEG